MAEGWALTIKAVAERFGVTRKAVYNWIDKKHLIALRLPGGDYRLRVEDVDEFERKCLTTSHDAAAAPGLPSPGTDCDSAAEPGPSAGPTPRVARLSPFQHGQRIGQQRKSGATSS